MKISICRLMICGALAAVCEMAQAIGPVDVIIPPFQEPAGACAEYISVIVASGHKEERRWRNTVGRRLKLARTKGQEKQEKPTLTQADVAEKLNLSSAQVSQIEAGVLELSVEQAEEIARYLNVSLPWLLGADVFAPSEQIQSELRNEALDLFNKGHRVMALTGLRREIKAAQRKQRVEKRKLEAKQREREASERRRLEVEQQEASEVEPDETAEGETAQNTPSHELIEILRKRGWGVKTKTVPPSAPPLKNLKGPALGLPTPVIIELLASRGIAVTLAGVK